MRILVVEDDAPLATFVSKGLEAEHYAVDVAGDGELGRQMAFDNDYDLMILDLNLPKLDGISVLQAVRSRKTSLSVLVLTARSRVEDRVQSLDTGADDCLIKPFSFTELSARVRALLRRGPRTVETVLRVSDLELDRVSRKVERGGKMIELTSKEFALLEYLMRNAGRRVTRAMIVEHVWNVNFDTSTNIVDVFCSLACFQAGLCRRLELAAVPRAETIPQPNRIPIGLVLLSQGAITSSQLRQALQIQKTTRTGRLGEWLMRMGAVTETQVTAALASQQRCPVFVDHDPQLLAPGLVPPLALLHRYRAVPVFHNAPVNTVYVGFLDHVDHAFLYSLEQMLRCRTRPCITTLSSYRMWLKLNAANSSGETIEIRERQASNELAGTIGDFAQQLGADRCSMTICGEQMWIRLEPQQKPQVDFLCRLKPSMSQ